MYSVYMTILYHPCMNEEAHNQIARIHLPVAPSCNTQCQYCERRISHEELRVHGPGHSTCVMTPTQAVNKTREFLNIWGTRSVVGIAGPGEPLANEQTFETFRLIRDEFPLATLCVCTNGIELPDKFDELYELRIRFLTVTINGVTPSIVSKIQPMIRKNGQTYGGLRAAEIIIESQFKGLRLAIDAGMFVKVNCVVIPNTNGDHIMDVARSVAGEGVHVFNPMPLIPRGRFRNMSKPSVHFMARIRAECERILPVFHQCKQCRADAEGIPGKERFVCAIRK